MKVQDKIKQLCNIEKCTYFVLTKNMTNYDTDSSFGKLYDSNGLFICDTVESIEHKIARGLYKVRFSFSPRFRRFLPCLVSWYDSHNNIFVDKSTHGYRIHSANKGNELRGCIALGDIHLNSLSMLVNSRLEIDNFIHLVEGQNFLLWLK